MASEMAAQKKLIDEPISSRVQPEPAPVKQPESEPFVIPPIQTSFETTAEPVVPEHTVKTKPEAGESSAPVDMKLLKRLDRFDEFIRKSQGTKRRPSEDHKTYAKRWRKIAAKVEPPMTENEIIGTFIKAHDPPYFEEIFRMTGCSFAAIVNKLEEYDDFVRAGKIVNLKAAGKIGTALPPTYPYGIYAGYNPQAVCAYHSGAPGHSTVDCKALKHRIQDMIEAGEIVIRKKEAQGPNINRNPLPEHTNTIGVILDYAEYEEQVQKLAREAEVFGVTDQPFVIEVPFEEDERPFILDLTLAESKALEPVVIEFPDQEPVLSLQRVPWNYDEPIIQIGEKSVAKEEVSVVTRSGRIASPFGATVPIQTNKPELPAKPTITEKEALDFLKRLQRSEYNVVEKLSKSPAQISMLDLLFSSDMHRDVLLEVLTKAQIPKDISVANFSHIVGSVLFTKQITFSDDELPAESIGHNEALYIVVRPWIHKSGAVPSSLHQLLKFIVNDKLITIFAEEDCFVIADSGSKEDGSRNATVTPHSTADIVSVSWITKGERALSKASVMMAKEMIRGGYEFDKGLGRDL
ncbi:uncharacterized protein [Coffea arabica]|uniref:Uncharacterized protein n=1 Tax=Coffea arabica TaxID=13443 RepID=A0ABM4VUH9_COFAR